MAGGDTFGTSIDVSGSLATNGDGFGAAGSSVAGVTLSGRQARFAWQAWHFRYLHRCQRKLGDEWGRIWRRWILRGRRDTFSTSSSICMAGVTLSVPPIDVSGSSATNGDGFGAAGSCAAGVTLSGAHARFAWHALNER